MNYEEDIKISPDDLDIECRDQPALMLKYGRHKAEMDKELALENEKLDLVKAETDKKIREAPEDFGITTKITETVITNTILATKEYKETYKKYLEVKFEAAVAKSAVDAVAQRKDMLEALIKLFGLQYFSGPKVIRDFSAEIEKKEKAVNSKIKTGTRTRRTSRLNQ